MTATLAEQPYTILVAVAGGSPAIVTETLWRLVQDGARIDEVRVITTATGARAVRQGLLESGQFAACCASCGSRAVFDETKLVVLEDDAGQALIDIRNSHENQLASDRICQLLREWTVDETRRLYCSVAGGRKTMSIYLTAALMLYGRGEDRLFHVLVQPEDFEFCRTFFFPCEQELTVTDRQGQSKTLRAADAQIDLAEIPFVRLRDLLGDQPAVAKLDEALGAAVSYSTMVREVQQRLRFLAQANRLEIGQLAGGEIPLRTGGEVFPLRPAEGLLYTIIGEWRQYGSKEGLAIAQISAEDLQRAYLRLTGYEYQADLVGDFKFLNEWIQQVSSYNPTWQKQFKEAVTVAISRPKRALSKRGFPPHFLIVNLNEGKRVPARYTIPTAPENILLPPATKKPERWWHSGF
ncbi:MAG: CRISPR-associated ring nuclease Csm6 [Blastocatellia bacterium]